MISKKHPWNTPPCWPCSPWKLHHSPCPKTSSARSVAGWLLFFKRTSSSRFSGMIFSWSKKRRSLSWKIHYKKWNPYLSYLLIDVRWTQTPNSNVYELTVSRNFHCFPLIIFSRKPLPTKMALAMTMAVSIGTSTAVERPFCPHKNTPGFYPEIQGCCFWVPNFDLKTHKVGPYDLYTLS